MMKCTECMCRICQTEHALSTLIRMLSPGSGLQYSYKQALRVELRTKLKL